MADDIRSLGFAFFAIPADDWPILRRTFEARHSLLQPSFGQALADSKSLQSFKKMESQGMDTYGFAVDIGRARDFGEANPTSAVLFASAAWLQNICVSVEEQLRPPGMTVAPGSGATNEVRYLHYVAQRIYDPERFHRHCDDTLLTAVVQSGPKFRVQQRADGSWLDLPPNCGAIVAGFGAEVVYGIDTTDHRVETPANASRVSASCFFNEACKAIDLGEIKEASEKAFAMGIA